MRLRNNSNDYKISIMYVCGGAGKGVGIFFNIEKFPLNFHSEKKIKIRERVSNLFDKKNRLIIFEVRDL